MGNKNKKIKPNQTKNPQQPDNNDISLIEE